MTDADSLTGDTTELEIPVAYPRMLNTPMPTLFQDQRTILQQQMLEQQNEGHRIEFFNLCSRDESTLSIIEKQQLMRLAYQYSDKITMNRESLQTVRRIVNQFIIPFHKFISGEHIDNYSTKAAEKLREFPSFWKPDFTQETKCKLHNEIFTKVGGMTNLPLVVKVQYWMGLQSKVLQSIRDHRAQVGAQLQKKVVEVNFDMYTSLKIVYSYFNNYFLCSNSGLMTLQRWENENKFEEVQENHESSSNQSNDQIESDSTSVTTVSTVSTTSTTKSSIFESMTEREIYIFLKGLREIRNYMRQERSVRDKLPLFLRSQDVSAEVFEAYLNLFLSCALKKLEWEGKRTDVRIGRLFTIFDEAFVILSMINSWKEWEILAKGGKINKKNKRTLYTWQPLDINDVRDTNQKVKIVRGWSNEGIKRYNKLLGELKGLRNTDVQVAMEESFRMKLVAKGVKRGRKRYRVDDSDNTDNNEQVEVVDPYTFEYSAV